ncbi:MAG TPA: DeoR/GlpR family DNA-binding transcription regulator [Lichenihabitans sp.]|nr:DeoR/GlpR family DNA-binding transcription regulator [Lichenihabitans sp.]
MGSKADQRVARLLTRVQGGVLLALSEAAGMFDVSEMTVRRDIASSRGRLTVLGGHVIAVTDPEPPYALDQEQDSHLADKLAACDHALDLIEPDDTIFIDSGTTTCHLAARLPVGLNLTVVCFAMNVAAILARMPTVRWILTGGLYQNATASFAGPHGPAMLKDIRLNKAFVSAGGVHPKLGVSCTNFSEVGMKRAAIDKAAESYLVIDGSKIDKVKPAYFADCSEFTAIISERGSLTLDGAR